MSRERHVVEDDVPLAMGIGVRDLAQKSEDTRVVPAGRVKTAGGPGLDTLLSRILITLGSAASIGFGIWHFFVPGMWNWDSYIDASATELVVAIRAINVFFSLSLVLFGLMNLLLAYGHGTSRYAALVVLGATCVLWSTRVVMQIVYPQGSTSSILEYGMLLSFALVLACYAVSLVLVIGAVHGKAA